MPKYLIKIVDDANDMRRMSGYRIINDEWGADDFQVDPDLFLEVNSNQFTYAKNLLDAGATITYPTSASLPLSVDDLTIVNVTPLKAAKVKAYSNIASQINNRLMSNLIFLNIYKFILTDNKLKNGGYFVTDENREQIYLDIVNNGDQNYIRALEEYLDAKDRMETDFWFGNKFLQFEDALRAATTVQEVKDLHDTAMGFFS
jgi:hypothetical protein